MTQSENVQLQRCTAPEGGGEEREERREYRAQRQSKEERQPQSVSQIGVYENHTIENSQEFLDTLLDQTVKRLNREPIDIYAFSTYLPANLRAKADELWTER